LFRQRLFSLLNIFAAFSLIFASDIRSFRHCHQNRALLLIFHAVFFSFFIAASCIFAWLFWLLISHGADYASLFYAFSFIYLRQYFTLESHFIDRRVFHIISFITDDIRHFTLLSPFHAAAAFRHASFAASIFCLVSFFFIDAATLSMPRYAISLISRQPLAFIIFIAFTPMHFHISHYIYADYFADITPSATTCRPCFHFIFHFHTHTDIIFHFTPIVTLFS